MQKTSVGEFRVGGSRERRPAVGYARLRTTVQHPSSSARLRTTVQQRTTVQHEALFQGIAKSDRLPNKTGH